MPACARRAWLTLGSASIDLEDPAGGWFCSNLDLGYPTVRDVVTNRPDQNGAADRTAFLGLRVVNAQIVALTGAGARIDEVAAAFAPFMDPAQRPTLHYILDRATNPERTMTVRAAGYSAPIAGPYERSIQLQWVAADPACYDPNPGLASAAAGGGTDVIANNGDLPARPVFHIIGNITGATITLSGPAPPAWKLAFLASYVIAAGHYVDIDTANRTVYGDGDPANNLLSKIDWSVSSWQWIPPGNTTMVFTPTGGGTAFCQAHWNDAYLI
jgi:hypothetical protein